MDHFVRRCSWLPPRTRNCPFSFFFFPPLFSVAIRFFLCFLRCSLLSFSLSLLLIVLVDSLSEDTARCKKDGNSGKREVRFESLSFLISFVCLLSAPLPESINLLFSLGRTHSPVSPRFCGLPSSFLLLASPFRSSVSLSCQSACFSFFPFLFCLVAVVLHLFSSALLLLVLLLCFSFSVGVFLFLFLPFPTAA